MHKKDYYKKTYNYYERVKNLWGDATKHPFLIEGFKFSINKNKHLLQIANLADISPGLSVLDCGCGFGELINFLDKKYPGTYTGITLNEYHVKNKQHNNIIKRNFENLSFIKTKSVDRVLFIESFSHAFNKVKVLKEVRRILKNDGKVFILDLSIANQDYLNLVRDRPKYNEHISFYGDRPVCSKYIMALIKNLNFKLIDYKENLNNSVFIDKKVESKIILHTINTFYNYYIFSK
jgi:ubiquinone/menaquinone biosynthesis C-methylase UbiE